MASDTDAPDSWTWAAMEPEPTDQERALYDKFADEYLRDGNASQAASRCGFQAGFAVEYGKQFITKSYVQRRIADLRSRKADTKADREYDHTLIVNTWRSIASDPYQKGSARVAAARELALLHGLRAPTKTQLDVVNGVRGGVVLLPGIAKLEDWEAAAAASQAALAEASRVA